MKIKKLFILVIGYWLLVIGLTGCATIPARETLPTYSLNGTTYLSLVPLCEARGINWDYDTFARTVVLSKGSHKISLWVGDRLVLVDGRAQTLSHPVDVYQGAVVVPYNFKEAVLDVLFKEPYPSHKAVVPVSGIRKVIIDAGHGGNDPGTIGKATGLREKDVNLDVAKRLGKLLRDAGIEVVMTRNIDKFIPLSKRADIANSANADLFISIHSNANRVRSLNGFEIYYVSSEVNDSKRALSSAQNAELNLKNANFANHSLNLEAIVWDMIYTNSRAESIELARSVCRAVGRDLNAKILGIKPARFEVLRNTRMPAVLIEIGFLSNPTEERRLKNSYYRQEVAEAIAEGLGDYTRGLTLAEAAE